MVFNIDVFSKLDKEWALLCAGNKDGFNAMTVSWGGLGTIWGKPAATVYVRHCRHTFGFMESSDIFTLSFYPPEMKQALSVMGSKSGKDCDKNALAGLVPRFLEKGVTFEKAEKTLVCRKMYSQDIDINALDPQAASKFYDGTPDNIHRLYIGEVLEII